MAERSDLEFFHRAAPEGRSRESTLRLDGSGRFLHDGEPIAHPGLEAALHRWVGRHPSDGRWILSNGYDWCYFEVEDAPFFVRRVRAEGGVLLLSLSDASEEVWDVAHTRQATSGALYASVKAQVDGGPFDARFDRHALAQLAEFLVEGEDGAIWVQVPGGDAVRFPGATTA